MKCQTCGTETKKIYEDGEKGDKMPTNSEGNIGSDMMFFQSGATVLKLEKTNNNIDLLVNVINSLKKNKEKEGKVSKLLNKMEKKKFIRKKSPYMLDERGKSIIKSCLEIQRRIEPIISNDVYFNRLYQVSSTSIQMNEKIVKP